VRAGWGSFLEPGRERCQSRARMQPDMNQITGSHDILWIVLDSLRCDVAMAEHMAGRTPCLASLTGGGWESRHTPGNFTLPAHVAFFAGFLPTPADAKADRQRLFAAKFAGSETTGSLTKTFVEDNIIAGLQHEGYRTVCVGGVGFFNRMTPLSNVLPGYFDESHWRTEFSVTDRQSASNQMAFAAELVRTVPEDQKLLLFINVSAVHQPNYFWLRESGPDDLETHAAALRAVDAELPVLLRAFAGRSRPVFYIVCSDHGTAYGEEGFHGHRTGHACVWTVPYTHGVLNCGAWREVS